jgi:hypothetical protein
MAYCSAKDKHQRCHAAVTVTQPAAVAQKAKEALLPAAKEETEALWQP